MNFSPESDAPFESLAGKILIASPRIRDGIFRHSVIYLSDHSVDDGASGYILNSSTTRLVEDIVPANELLDLAEVPVFIGGPVADDRISFGTLETDTLGNVSFSTMTSPESAQASSSSLHCYIGYSGWSSGQLESELKEGTWIVASTSLELLGSAQNGDDYWRSQLRRLSPYHELLAEAIDHPVAN